MAYIGKSPDGTGVRSRFYYTQTSGGGTSVSGSSDDGTSLAFSDGAYVDVFLNGVLLVAGTDYNTSTANTIAGLAALANGDVVEVVVYDIFTVADTVSALNGGTFSNSVTIDKDGGTALTVDRATSDGTIVDLQKNGTSVGAIGVAASDDFYIGASTANHAGVYFGTDIVYPMRANSLSDGVTSLGHSSNRFNNLYLGGNLYIGGTGSANALDDYEEGTFTATLNGGSSTPSTRLTTTGQYTKIGNKVTVSFEFHNVTTTSYSGDVRVFGMPFASSNPGGTVRQVTGSIGIYSMGVWDTASSGLFGIIGELGTEWYLYANRSNDSWYNVQHSAGSSRYLIVNATYIVA